MHLNLLPHESGVYTFNEYVRCPKRGIRRLTILNEPPLQLSINRLIHVFSATGVELLATAPPHSLQFPRMENIRGSWAQSNSTYAHLPSNPFLVCRSLCANHIWKSLRRIKIFPPPLQWYDYKKSRIGIISLQQYQHHFRQPSRPNGQMHRSTNGEHWFNSHS